MLGESISAFNGPWAAITELNILATEKKNKKSYTNQ